jgi:hypothetical protein
LPGVDTRLITPSPQNTALTSTDTPPCHHMLRNPGGAFAMQHSRYPDGARFDRTGQWRPDYREDSVTGHSD